MSKHSHLTLLLVMTTLLTVAVLAAFDANAGDQEGTSMKTIEGSVLYRERMLLPEDAEVRVSLEDVARADALADIIATTTFRPKGATPFAFSLEFDPQRLRDQGRYALRARIEAAGRLLFTSTDHIPAFEGGHEPVKIMVSRVGDTRAGQGHPTSMPDASLTDTYWKLSEMEGRPTVLGAGQRELHLVLGSEGNRVHGFTGCNRFTGTYKLDKLQITFGQLASTRMTCMEGMEQEQRFLDALSRTVRFAISGESLVFHGPEGEPILRFQSVYLK